MTQKFLEEWFFSCILSPGLTTLTVTPCWLLCRKLEQLGSEQGEDEGGQSWDASPETNKSLRQRHNQTSSMDNEIAILIICAQDCIGPKCHLDRCIHSLLYIISVGFLKTFLMISGHFTRPQILDNFPGHAATFASFGLPTSSILSRSYEEH